MTKKKSEKTEEKKVAIIYKRMYNYEKHTEAVCNKNCGGF